jgi:hypothetical protein
MNNGLIKKQFLEVPYSIKTGSKKSIALTRINIH